MILSDLDAAPTLAVHRGSYAHRELAHEGWNFDLFDSREELAEIIRSTKFEILISEGCPFIIPISELQRPGQLFINLHPAILPDHRGPIPVISAMYYFRNAGATCHMMTDRVDVGPYIAQVPIKLDPSISLELLYQLSFRAEAKALKIAIARNFEVAAGIAQAPWRETVFTRRDAIELRDMHLDMTSGEIEARVRALAIGNRFATIQVNGQHRMVHATRVLQASTMNTFYPDTKPSQIVHAFGETLIVRTRDEWMALELVP
ncbi:Formyl transferase [Tardiphaga sp. OK245]|nr:Formyl transferase [Tardiphaga sp. OK245]